MGVQKSLRNFQESLKSENSVKSYTFILGMFKDYYKIKNFDDIVSIDKNELDEMITTYIVYLKKKINPNTVPAYINPIKTFLEMNDIDLNWRKLKKLYPQKIKRSGSSAYQTEDIKKMLSATTSLRNKALIHFLASTGVRVGSIPDLTLRHIRDMPNYCKMVLVYEDSTEEYKTFLTPEASTALDDYLDERKKHGEMLNNNSPLFRERYQLAIAKPKPISLDAIQAIITRTLRKASLRGQKKNGRYSEQLVHGFRKRFNIILKINKDIDNSAIEKMMGHSVTIQLDGAYLPDDDPRVATFCFDEFSKGIIDLTISDEERDKVKIQTLENEKSELEQVQKKLESSESLIQKQFKLMMSSPGFKEEVRKALLESGDFVEKK